MGDKNQFWFPCTLKENESDDEDDDDGSSLSSGTIMLPPE